MRKNIQQYLKWLAPLSVAALVAACSGSGTVIGGAGGSANLTLNVDQMSPVPLVNGQPQTFYMYVTNYGKQPLSNLNWSAALQNSTNNENLLSKIKSSLSNVFSSKPAIQVNTSDAINIVDASQCATVAPGGTCRIELQANTGGAILLNVQSESQNVSMEGGGGFIQANNYPTVNTGNPADTLSLSPISTISYGGSGGSYNFYIINNGSLPVELTSSALGVLPANVSLTLGNCPNPLASGMACQARLVFTNSTASTNQELSIPLNLGGNIINSDGSKTPLPTQNANTTLQATTATIGIIQVITNQTLIVDASYGTAAPVAGNGVISNSGTASLVVNSIKDSSDLITVSNDNCSGKTLAPGEICTYTPNLTVGSITSSGTATIKINYNDTASSSEQTANSSINWTYIPTLPVAAPSINLSTSQSNLNQVATSTTVTLTNNGNVALSDLTDPSFNPANSHLRITAKTCTDRLAVNASCNYTVTYTPSAPSETSSVILSNISASSPDNRGGTLSTTFSNSTAINISSVFGGLLSLSGTLNLNDTTSSGMITVSNDGNYTATISNIAMQAGSDANLVINDGSCTTTTVLNAGQTCTVGVKLNSTIASGSGNGTVLVTYNNHNGTTNASSSNSNIAWLIGTAPSLNVNFAHNSLTTVVTVESDTVVTLTNNGKDNLNSIVLPTLSAPLEWKNAPSNSCALNGSQNLAIGESCAVTLAYTPTTAFATDSFTLGSFSATNASAITPYSTSSYSTTLTALTPSAILANPSSVTQNVSWASSSTSNNVTLHNSGQTAATITSVSSNNGVVTTENCGNGTIIEAGADCILQVNGNYSTSANAVLTIAYTDTAGNQSTTINVTGNYAAKPVVSPNLVASATSLFAQTINQEISTTSTPYVITLTNNTTATNNGNTSVSIPYANLLPPAGETASYSINTAGIISNPCSLPSPESSMLLAGSATCNYNLVINTGATTSNLVSQKSQKSLNISVRPVGITQTITANYYYNVYANNTTTPSLTGLDDSGNSYSFTLNITPHKAQLSVALSNGQSSTAFNGVESGLSPAPTMNLTITNTGGGAVSGTVSANLPVGITGDFSSCNNLAANNATCNVTLTMSTANVISPANLNTSSINYNDGTQATTASFPSINYSVVAPAAPNVTMATTVTGCVVGNGTSSTCYNNPNSMGGTASAQQVTLTFTNTSPTTTATSIALTDSTVITIQGYIQASNSCTNGAAANNGTCSIVYSMPSTAASGAIQPNVTAPNFAFSAAYTTPQSQQLQASFSSNLTLMVNVIAPTLAIASISDITPGGSSPVSVTWSNLYQSSVPTTNVVANTTSNNAVSGLTPNPAAAATCGEISNAGASCTSTVAATTSVAAGTYRLTASAYSSLISKNRSFTVLSGPKIVIVAPTTYTGDLGSYAGANTKCQAAGDALFSGSTWKAMLQGSGATTSNVNYYRYDSSKSDKLGVLIGTGAQLQPFGTITALTNPISASANIYYWYGAHSPYGDPTTISGSDDCSDVAVWSSAGGTKYGTLANGSSTNPYNLNDSNLLYGFNGLCSASYNLVCVQQ